MQPPRIIKRLFNNTDNGDELIKTQTKKYVSAAIIEDRKINIPEICMAPEKSSRNEYFIDLVLVGKKILCNSDNEPPLPLPKIIVAICRILNTGFSLFI